MLRKFLGYLVALGLPFCVTAITSNQTVSAAEFSIDRFAEQFEKGKQLERDRRWQEAIQHYEKLARKFPQQPEVEQRLQIVRIHFDVTRRCSDKSFIDTIDRSSPNAALDVMGEVLTKLQVYYVEAIDFSRLLRNGTAFLEVALTEEEFRGRYVNPQVAPNVVESFRTS
jgi:carboxyl-terminal processing protease